jgi:membrane-associated phospholipid phosphatase
MQAQPVPPSPAGRWDRPIPRAAYLALLAGQYAVWLTLYLGVNAATAGRNAAQPMLPFEPRIPLVAAAYPIYASVYLEIVLPLFLARTRRAFLRTQLAITVASLLAFAVFLAAPMPYPRPVLTTQADFHGLLALEWAVDGPRCTFPSLHVAIAFVLWLGLRDEAPRWRLPLLLLAIAVAISTVLVKQHFIADVAAGAVLAAVAWRLSGPVMVRLARLTDRGA